MIYKKIKTNKKPLKIDILIDETCKEPQMNR